jgi:hypothetical protein
MWIIVTLKWIQERKEIVRAQCLAVISYRLDDGGVGVRVPIWLRIFPSPRRPDRLRCPPSLLSNGYRGLFTRDKATGTWSWPLTSSWCRGQEIVDLYINSPIRPHGVGANLQCSAESGKKNVSSRFMVYLICGDTVSQFSSKMPLHFYYANVGLSPSYMALQPRRRTLHVVTLYLLMQEQENPKCWCPVKCSLYPTIRCRKQWLEQVFQWHVR